MDRGGIRIGSIYGIEITLDYSWFIIFAIITFGLSFALFPQLVPGLSLAAYIAIGAITSLLFFGSVLFHELMHSIVAIRNGLEIEGIRLLIFGGVSQITEEPRTPGLEFKMALAGPLSSLVLGGVLLGIFFATRQLGSPPAFLVPVFWLGYINVVLGLFNLLPGFPLDGGRVLRSAIWYFTGSLRRATAIAAGFGKGLAYLMILTGIAVPLLFDAINFIWFALLGWYLLRAAESGYRQVLYHEALEGVKVHEIMTENPETVSPSMSVQELVREHFMLHNWVAYPVVEGVEVRGIVSIRNVENLPRERWETTRVAGVMRPLSPDITIRPDAGVYDILQKLVTKADGRLLVMEGERLVGIITDTDVNRAIVRRLHLGEEERPAA